MDLVTLGRALDDGVTEGVLPTEGEPVGAELRAARTWLFLLGYLKRDTESDSLDREFLVGLNAFRAEAAIGDGSATNQFETESLTALMRMVCFELPTDHGGFQLANGHRFAKLLPGSRASTRAIALRLYALDLLARPPRFGERHDELLARTEAGIRRFSAVSALLGFRPSPSAVTANTVAALFDFEAMLARLRTGQGPFVSHPDRTSPRKRRRDDELANRVVDALARIELWLVGYLARPRRHLWPRDNANRSLPSALRAFWRDRPESDRPPSRELEAVDRRFFVSIAALGSSDAQSDALEDDELQAALEQDHELAKAVRKESRSIGARLLDGLKRAARFVLGWFRSKLRKLIALARSLAGLLVRRVRRVFADVRLVLYALRDSWRFLIRKPVPGSSVDQLLVLHDKDFDFVLLQDIEADVDAVRVMGRRLSLTARMMAGSSRFVSLLLNAVITLAKRSGIGGWFGVVLVLANVHHWWGDMREVVDSIAVAEAELRSLPAA
ncbi:MAG: hypothetical protein AAGE01_13475 [Pseudomonadota bacterium]